MAKQVHELDDLQSADVAERLLASATPNALRVWQAACSERERLGHSYMGSEHFVLGLISLSSSSSSSSSPLPHAVVWLNSRDSNWADALLPLISNHFPPPKSPSPTPSVPLTPALQRLLRRAVQVGDSLNCAITSDVLLVALLLEPRSAATELLVLATDGRVNATSVLNAFDPEHKLDFWKAMKEQSWHAFQARRGLVKAWGAYEHDVTVVERVMPPLPAVDDPALEELVAGPTGRCNYVIPGRVLHGAFPDANTAIALVRDHQVTTMVCLVGELSPSAYKEDYPSDVRHFLQGEDLPVEHVNFIFFPIGDFETKGDAATAELAAELAHRIVAGEVLYVHCLGGHGRSGILIVALLIALFGISAKEASRRALAYHNVRSFCRGWRSYCHIPETKEQLAQAVRICPQLSREQHKRLLAQKNLHGKE